MKEAKTTPWDIVIIGGGAGGLCAAIAAKRTAPKLRVGVLERRERVGKKLLATGNGRCNFTNRNVAPCCYHGGEGDFVRPALHRFSWENTIEFFHSIGMEYCEEEEGKCFPYSLQSAAVLDLLRLSVERSGGEIITEAEVTMVKPQKNRFLLTVGEERIVAKRVIFAMGGAAATKLGGTHKGYALAKALGHTVTPLYPALSPIKTENELTKALKGIKIEGTVRLKKGDTCLGQAAGEILFTDYGLSGPPILRLSRLLAGREGEDLVLAVDFCPAFSQEELTVLLQERRSLFGEVPLEFFFTGFLQKKLGQLLLKRLVGEKLSVGAARLSFDDLQALSCGLKEYAFPVIGSLGWEHAQVTVGGVDTHEVSAATMESKLVRGCYFCGEILDVDGDCGGFNLQWAWSSGRLAGESAAEEVCDAEN